MKIQSNISNIAPKTTSFMSALLFAALIGTSFAVSAQAQDSTLRNPYIPGANYSQPYQCPPEGCPPPLGHGSSPAPVTPGHSCPPENMPWVRYIPSNQIDQQDSYVGLPGSDTVSAPYTLGSQMQVPHPPSTPGYDGGSLPGPMNFAPPPATVTNIRPEGGMPGDYAPTQRWGGQATRDLGIYRTHGAMTTDFGEKLSQKPDLQATPQFSQDVPRPTSQGSMGGGSTRSSFNGAQAATDLHGNRVIRNNTRSRLTIAPY